MFKNVRVIHEIWRERKKNNVNIIFRGGEGERSHDWPRSKIELRWYLYERGARKMW